MDFMPAMHLTSFSGIGGYGGIAVNVDGTLFASVHGDKHCVYIYSLADRTADPVVLGTYGIKGSAHGQLNFPIRACFVRRDGRDTLLICDFFRVVEFTSDGAFLRAIASLEGNPYGIAYCCKNDTIAVTLLRDHSVILLQYESGEVKPEVTIGSRTAGTGNADGELSYPTGVTFTADGDCILVADCYNDRVSKFSAASGEFIAHVATKAANGILRPRDVLQCNDGSTLVAQWYSARVARVGEDGVTVHNNIIIPSASGGGIYSLSYSPSLHGVFVKTVVEGNVFLLRDAWVQSSRCAWLSALSMS